MVENGQNRRREAVKWFAWFAVALLLAVVMLYMYYGFPRRGIGPQQPVYFSHRIHAGVKQINCRFCHPNVERSEHAGLPDVEKCFFCHKYVIPLHPEIQKEKAHLDAKIPVPWVQIFYVPDFVKFQHLPHVGWKKLDCSECHGHVETMDRLRPVDFKMGFCINCHKKLGAQTDCWLACHH